VSCFKSFNTAATARSRVGFAAATLGAVLVIAGCGSSSSSSITVGAENNSNNSLIKAGESTAATTSSATATTPTSGPLSKEPVVTPPSGPAPTKLETKDLITGTGPAAKTGQPVTVNYLGVLYKGAKKFNASWETGKPFPFTLGTGQVIAGWEQGILGMKVGGRRELIIPASLAYGAKGRPGIPPNAALVFVVDLLSV
jgi:peptidylprolyl isomerase